MITQELPEIGLDILFSVFSTLITTLGGVVLDIIVGAISVGWDYLVDLIAGNQYANPAIFLIAMMLLFTAWKITTSEG